jgi:voltage-gated potassium channel
MRKDPTCQDLFHSVFHDAQSRYFVVVNDILAILTIISVLTIAIETVDALARYHTVFLFIEYLTVFFFALEYIGRIIAAKRPWKYIFSFFGIIDLVAIVPTFFGIANLTFLKSMRIIRILRFLRMLRLAKLMRLHKAQDDIEESGHDALYGITMQIYIVTLMGTILLSATMIWLFEGDRTVFDNIPIAMLWSSKVVLGGVPQEMPQTIAGELVVIGTRFVGLILFGLLISITGASVKRILLGTRKMHQQRRS